MELQYHQHRVDWENASVLKQEHGYWKRRGTDDFTGHRSVGHGTEEIATVAN